jgi:hypothetical protein
MAPAILTPTHDPSSVCPAHLYGQAGYLARVDRALVFLDTATGEVTTIEPDMVNWLTVRGPVAPDRATAIVAQMRGTHDYLNCCMGS